MKQFLVCDFICSLHKVYKNMVSLQYEIKHGFLAYHLCGKSNHTLNSYNVWFLSLYLVWRFNFWLVLLAYSQREQLYGFPTVWLVWRQNGSLEPKNGPKLQRVNERRRKLQYPPFNWWYSFHCSVLVRGANIAGHVQTKVALTICCLMHSTWSIRHFGDDPDWPIS